MVCFYRPFFGNAPASLRKLFNSWRESMTQANPPKLPGESTRMLFARTLFSPVPRRASSPVHVASEYVPRVLALVGNRPNYVSHYRLASGRVRGKERTHGPHNHDWRPIRALKQRSVYLGCSKNRQ